jgi:predicted alpha/beta hydrolase
VDQLHGFYRNARVERRHLAPRDVGRARIGHFGYFLPASRDNLWRDTLDWLRSI